MDKLIGGLRAVTQVLVVGQEIRVASISNAIMSFNFPKRTKTIFQTFVIESYNVNLNGISQSQFGDIISICRYRIFASQVIFFYPTSFSLLIQK